MIEPADMINVMMRREDLVDSGEWYFQRGEFLWRTRPTIEQEFFSAGFNEDRGRRLAAAGEGGAGTQQSYADLVICQRFTRIKILAAHYLFTVFFVCFL
jgi:hypothetical protein